MSREQAGALLGAVRGKSRLQPWRGVVHTPHALQPRPPSGSLPCFFYLPPTTYSYSYFCSYSYFYFYFYFYFESESESESEFHSPQRRYPRALTPS